MPLNIFEPRYMAMIDDALRGDRLIGMVQPESDGIPGSGEGGNASPGRLYRVGCAGRITQLAETGDGRYLLTLTGIARFRVVEELTVMTPYRQVRADFLPLRGGFHCTSWRRRGRSRTADRRASSICQGDGDRG